MRARVCVAALLLGAATICGAAESAAADANLRLGVAYLLQGNYAVAKDKLERARTQAPNDQDVLTALALLYARIGDNDKAEADFRSAFRVAPKDPELANNYAIYLCDRGRTAEGVKRFEQAATDPLYATPWAAYTNAGICLRNARQDGEAEKMFQKALQLRPSHAEATYQLALLELSQKRAADATARVEKFVVGNVAQPAMLMLGWLAATEAGDKVTAVKMARRLQTQYPDSDEARGLLKGGAQ